MIKINEFKELNYDQKKEYLVSILDALPVQFKTSRSILMLLKKNSPSENFLVSVFNQVGKMEKCWLDQITSEEKENEHKCAKITDKYNNLTQVDQKEAEEYLLKELNNL